jgi:sugar phosphate isomerase/epimerase
MSHLALTSDFAGGDFPPHDALRHIAAAGFRHVHWCHEWRSDYLYSAEEQRRIAEWFAELGLRLDVLHGSAGAAHSWEAPNDALRQAGVALVKNRIDFAADLDCGVVVMHVLAPTDVREHEAYWSRLRRSFDELQPYAAARGVRLALENLPEGNTAAVERLLGEYPSDFLGVCYDAGHGNMTGDGLDWLERVQGRLIALHLHDNDGRADCHWPPFAGTVDWPRLASLIARSGYTKPAMTIESNWGRMATRDPAAYAQLLAEAGRRFAAMVEAERGRP